MRVILIFLFVLMIIVTLLGFSDSICRFTFAGGSDSMMLMFESSMWIKIVLLLIFGFLLKFHPKYFSFGLILFVFWFLSGRTLGFFPDGKIISGWFYLESDKINICEEEIDCENVMYYQLKFEKLNFWRIRVVTRKIDEVIFLGPFIWKDVLNNIENNYPNSLQTSTPPAPQSTSK